MFIQMFFKLILCIISTPTGAVGQQQFVFVCWGVVSGGVAAEAGTGEV